MLGEVELWLELGFLQLMTAKFIESGHGYVVVSYNFTLQLFCTALRVRFQDLDLSYWARKIKH